jgi:hypothetical protein
MKADNPKRQRKLFAETLQGTVDLDLGYTLTSSDHCLVGGSGGFDRAELRQTLMRGTLRTERGGSGQVSPGDYTGSVRNCEG